MHGRPSYKAPFTAALWAESKDWPHGNRVWKILCEIATGINGCTLIQRQQADMLTPSLQRWCSHPISWANGPTMEASDAFCHFYFNCWIHFACNSSDAMAIWVNIPFDTNFSFPLETEKTSDSVTLIFLPLFTTFDRQTMSGPIAGLK
jgi:hypothetical protein